MKLGKKKKLKAANERKHAAGSQRARNENEKVTKQNTKGKRGSRGAAHAAKSLRWSVR